MTASISILIAAATVSAPPKLPQAQVGLESYLTQIETLEMTYTETWTSSDPSIRTRGGYVREVHLVYAFPSVRYDETFKTFKPTGEIKKEVKRTRCFHRGKKTWVNYKSKQLNVTTSYRKNDLPKTPILGIGLVTPGTFDVPLFEFVNRATDIQLAEEGDGVSEPSWLLAIGEPLIDSVRPSSWRPGANLKVWLAPGQQFLPTRMKVDTKVSFPALGRTAFMDVTASDFGSAEDIKRGSHLPFPRKMTYKDLGGEIEWRIHQVVFNKRFSEQVFQITRLKGFTVSEDGKRRRLSGGKLAANERATETVDQAKQLLASVDPPPQDRSIWFWIGRLTAPVFFILVLAFGIFLFKRRA